jgi:hypothetical protein
MKLYNKKLNTSPEFSVKDVDTTGRILSLYWSAFDNKDRDGDVIVKGAFKKSIQEQGPKGLGEQWFIKFHNPDLPIATPFELEEDNYGLLARIKLAADIPVQDDTLKMYRDGHFKHQSIGYRAILQQKVADYNEIREIKLYEGSLVLWAANPNARFVDIKGFMTEKDISKELELTIKGLRNGDYTDDGFALLEIKMRQLIQAAADLQNSTLAAINAPEPPAQVKATEDYSALIKELQNAKTSFNYAL